MKERYFVYILKSLKDKNIYIGQTKDIGRRLKEHNSGRMKSTKGRKPFILIGQVKCSSRQKAVEIEKHLKKSYIREQLRKKIKKGEVAEWLKATVC